LYKTALASNRKFIQVTTEKQLKEALKDKAVNELIFCMADLQYTKVFDCMEEYAGKNLVFKMAPGIGPLIIGSHAIFSR
jgi:predicted GTPase